MFTWKGLHLVLALFASSITLHEICKPAKVKKLPFRGIPSQILFTDLAKMFKLFFLTCSKFRSSCFQEMSFNGSVFKVSFIYFLQFHESYFRTLSFYYS